jgi:hypothetical protein
MLLPKKWKALIILNRIVTNDSYSYSQIVILFIQKKVFWYTLYNQTFKTDNFYVNKETPIRKDCAGCMTTITYSSDDVLVKRTCMIYA